MSAMLRSVVVTTNDLASTQRYYEQALKMTADHPAAREADEISQLWGLRRRFPIKSTVMRRRPDDTFGYLRLVEITGAGGSDIAEGYQPYDLGVLDFGFSVLGVREKVAAVAGLGHEVIGEPTRYDFDYYKDQEPFYVIDSIVAAPNHIRIDMLERVNPPYSYGVIDPDTGFSEIVHAALVVADVDESVRFYHEVLGVPLRGLFRDVSEPAFAALLKTAPGERIDWAFLGDLQQPGSYVEVIAPQGKRGRQMVGQRSLFNYGVAALSFSVDDVLAAHARATHAKIEIVCDPVEIRSASGPAELAFSCYAPSQILCEVRQSQA